MTALTDRQRRCLADDGFVVLPALLSADDAALLRARLEELWRAEGARAGRENNVREAGVRRLANLAAKGEVFRRVYGHPLVLAAVEEVVGPDIRLSMLNAREAPPGGTGASQPLHCDTDLGGRPDERGFYSCTAVWMLDDFTASNGATRIVPRSHRRGRVPADELEDPAAAVPDEIPITGARGDVAVFNGHCWHRGGANHSDAPRLGVLAHYLRADIVRTGVRRQHLPRTARAALSPDERILLGVGEPQILGRLRHAAGHLGPIARSILGLRRDG